MSEVVCLELVADISDWSAAHEPAALAAATTALCAAGADYAACEVQLGCGARRRRRALSGGGDLALSARRVYPLAAETLSAAVLGSPPAASEVVEAAIDAQRSEAGLGSMYVAADTLDDLEVEVRYAENVGGSGVLGASTPRVAAAASVLANADSLGATLATRLAVPSASVTVEAGPVVLPPAPPPSPPPPPPPSPPSPPGRPILRPGNSDPRSLLPTQTAI